MGLPIFDASNKDSASSEEQKNQEQQQQQATGAGANTGAGVTRPKTEEEKEADRLYEEAMEEESSTQGSDNYPEHLRGLATGIKDLSGELLGALEALKLKKKSKWKSFVLAMKEVLNKEKLDEMSGRLSKLQVQLNTHIQLELKDEVAKLSKSLADIELNNLKFDLKRNDDISSMKADQERIRGVSKKTTTLTDQPTPQTNTTTDASSENQQGNHDHWASDIHLQVEKLRADMEALEEDQKLLQSLWFDRMALRYENLSEAHTNTFSWIFRGVTQDLKKPIRFVEWLRDDHGVYWVQGKAGSGKSTLMKFLCQHPETFNHLSYWAGNQEVITAHFFFWNSGTPLQKSQIGLLRSLLYEILRQCPELLPQVRAEISSWTNYNPGDKSITWGLKDLLRAYDFVVKQKAATKFCFFIDGLDEYKPEGDKDCRHLVKTLKLLGSSPTIKLCLSSRPWTIFNDAFGQSSGRMIKLEDLTRQDIYRYVSDKLQEHDQYDKLVKSDGSYAELIEEVVRKAQGVFLWVFLVVRDLLEGLTCNDTMRTLYLRLSQFPDDLEGYFRRIFDSIPKSFRRETAQMFQIALATEGPLQLLVYSYFDDVASKKPTLVMDSLDSSRTEASSVKDMDAMIRSKHDTMRRRLDGRSKGLLEVVTLNLMVPPIGEGTYYVDFLHRTVRDYLQTTEDMISFMAKDIGPKASLFTNLCSAVFFAMRALTYSHGPFDIDAPESLWRNLLTFAYKAQRCGADPCIVNRILDEALKLGGRHLNYERLLKQACEYGLLHYVEHSLSAQSPTAKLSIAEQIFPSCLRPNPVSQEFSPRVVAYLLDAGVDPNKSLGTPVFGTEESLISGFKSRLGSVRDREGVPEIIRLLISSGANFDPQTPTGFQGWLSPSGLANANNPGATQDSWETARKIDLVTNHPYKDQEDRGSNAMLYHDRKRGYEGQPDETDHPSITKRARHDDWV